MSANEEELTDEEMIEYIKNYEDEIRSHGLDALLTMDENGLYIVAV